MQIFYLRAGTTTVPRSGIFATFAGSFGLFFTLFTLFVRFLPMVAIAEVKSVLPQAHVHNRPE